MKWITLLCLLPLNLSFKIQKTDFQNILRQTWNSIKERNIDAYEIPLVHRPRSETPRDAVSEGIGYGLILSLYMNDSHYFNLLLDTAETYMWNGKYHDWQCDEFGNVVSIGAATDAEEDIALMCIFADQFVQTQKWSPHVTPKGFTYKERAQQILDSMWNENMIVDGKYVAPGAGWGGSSFVNPGYFAPAWYKIFTIFDSNPNHDWISVIDQCYDTLKLNIGYSKGLVADWMTPWGTFYENSLGYNAFDKGRSFYKDAIRILWRLSVDALWFQEQRAIDFLQKSFEFLESIGGISQANFFDLQGSPVSTNDVWIFDGGLRQRPRYEHSHLTVGMWSIVPFSIGNITFAEVYAQELFHFYDPVSKTWGLPVDPSGFEEDQDHNELYFDQFLAWFGASILQGIFTNPFEEKFI